MSRKISVEQVISDSFSLWKQGMKYNLIFSVLYYGLFFIFALGVSIHLGIFDEIKDIIITFFEVSEFSENKLINLLQKPEYKIFYQIMIIVSLVVYPLNIGLLEVIRKVDEQEKINIDDFLVGYLGINFFKYTGYWFPWMIIFSASSALSEILDLFIKILWISLTFLVLPIMHYKKEPLGISMLMSANILRENFLLIIVGVIMTIVMNYLGILLFGIGHLFTFSFGGG